MYCRQLINVLHTEQNFKQILMVAFCVSFNGGGGLFVCTVSEVGGSETNREIVSVRSHARTRGLVLRSELGKKRLGAMFSLFPFGPGG